MNKKFSIVIIVFSLLLIIWLGMGVGSNELPYVTIDELSKDYSDVSMICFQNTYQLKKIAIHIQIISNE